MSLEDTGVVRAAFIASEAEIDADQLGCLGFMYHESSLGEVRGGILNFIVTESDVPMGDMSGLDWYLIFIVEPLFVLRACAAFNTGFLYIFRLIRLFLFFLRDAILFFLLNGSILFFRQKSSSASFAIAPARAARSYNVGQSR